MKYKRILIKLSGEMLGKKSGGFSAEAAETVVQELKSILSSELEVAILIGGGNIVRSRDLKGIDRVEADFMGMTATIINALGLKNILNKFNIQAKILSTINLSGIIEKLSVDHANNYLNENKIVIFAGGTGAPFFTTDTAAALRALEIKADIVLKATRVDGVYDKDPEKFNDAKLLKNKISFDEALKNNLNVMDMTAILLLKENNIPVRVFNFLKSGNLKKIIAGEDIGTLIKKGRG